MRMFRVAAATLAVVAACNGPIIEGVTTDNSGLSTTDESSSGGESTSSTSTSGTTTSPTTSGATTSTTTTGDTTAESTTDANTTGEAVCGDGTVNGNEACDDGVNNGRYGGCAADCASFGPRCGDGLLNGPEECDDANDDDTDACLTTCVAATCGDLIVQEGVEQCDDGRHCVNAKPCLSPEDCQNIPGDDKTCLPRDGDGCSMFCQAG